MVFLALIPQIRFWHVRGSEWQGAYATLQGDEFLYSAYVNALIDGRPRRNDPFAGKNSTSQSPLPESTFSIQFVPPYTLALLARVFQLSASTAFIVLTAAASLLASAALFWLLNVVTGDPRVAATGVFVVLCLGELAGDQGMLGVFLLNHKLTVLMPFLRRYQPVLPLPFFFVFCALVWQALSTANKWRLGIYALLAGFSFALLVFSYLYLWTAAAAWLGCLASVWLGLRPREERRRSLLVFTITGSMMILALVPYVYLLSKRSQSLDDAQILVFTHQLDLFQPPELIGALLLVALILGARLRKLKLSGRRSIFAASFALLPFLVFNQQLLTGRTMQPFHFELFVVNYAVLVSLTILAPLIWQSIQGRVLLLIAALCFSWGLIEMNLLARARSASDVIDDQTIPVLLRLKELAKGDGASAKMQNPANHVSVVFSPHVSVMRLLPTWTSQATLLGAGAQDFGSATRKERKELLYMQLYYSGIDAARFSDLLNQRTEDTYMNFYAPSVVFGDERFIPSLSLNYRPIQRAEIEGEVGAYKNFVEAFSYENVLRLPLAYVITRVGDSSNLSNLDRWYRRDAGEQFGSYTLYRLSLLSPERDQAR